MIILRRSREYTGKEDGHGKQRKSKEKFLELKILILDKRIN